MDFMRSLETFHHSLNRPLQQHQSKDGIEEEVQLLIGKKPNSRCPYPNHFLPQNW